MASPAMEAIVLFARLALAAVFVVAGVAKLLDRRGSRAALVGFGLPPVVAGWGSVALPLAELGVAAALLPAVSATWGAGAALTLLAGFSGGIAINLLIGRRPDCHCFGQLHSAPVGLPTLARNLALALVAAAILAAGGGGASATAWLARLDAADAALLSLGTATALAFGVMGWFLLNVVRQNGRLILRVERLEASLAIRDGRGVPVPPPAVGARGVPIGSPAPDFALPGVEGGQVSLASLCSLGRPLLLVFTDPQCGPCTSLLPDLARWQRLHASALTVALLSRRTAEMNRAKAREHGLERILLQREREVDDAFGVAGTPAAVLVGLDGEILSAIAEGAEAIRALVERTTAAPPALLPAMVNGARPGARPVALGEVAPAIALPGLEGEAVSLDDFRGRPLLVLFWNPDCGFCRRMLPDLRALEGRRRPGLLPMLIVSSGEVAANRAMGLRSRVVVDGSFATGRAYGAAGTPSAVLVDAEGKIASGVAVGAEAVLALAGGDVSVAGEGAP